ncbi:MAG: hypothetical protein LBE65_03815, partial [Synergistaceae bacterium]|nr:hypothetical protein [Synergistaceae bacterium]
FYAQFDIATVLHLPIISITEKFSAPPYPRLPSSLFGEGGGDIFTVPLRGDIIIVRQQDSKTLLTERRAAYKMPNDLSAYFIRAWEEGSRCT